MPEYVENSVQTIALGESIPLDASIPCTSGYVIHEDGTGTFVLRGVSNRCSAMYKVTFNGNIAVPDGVTVGPIAIALALNGDARSASRAIVTPAADEEYFNVTTTGIITVPRGTAFTVSVKAVSALNPGGTGTPTPSLNVQNANLTIDKIQ